MHYGLRIVLTVLEGVFRSFTGKVTRTEEGVIHAIDHLYRQHGYDDKSLRTFFIDAAPNAIFYSYEC